MRFPKLVKNGVYLVFYTMENFFYAHTSTKSFFWKKRISSWWRENCDRRYMKSMIYPAVGTYLRNSETKRVLDIGSKWY